MEIIEENGIEYNVFNDIQGTCWRISNSKLTLSRINGPAVTWKNGQKEYWLDGVFYPEITSDEEWIIFQIL